MLDSNYQQAKGKTMAQQEIQDFVDRMIDVISSLDDAHEQGTCDIDCYYCDCDM